jgi:uncharacterized protein involved in exopolysaccharide biosynthesis
LSPVFSHLEVLAETYRKQQETLTQQNEQSTSLRGEIDNIQIVVEAD